MSDGNGNAIGRSVSGNLTFSPAITRYHVENILLRILLARVMARLHTTASTAFCF